MAAAVFGEASSRTLTTGAKLGWCLVRNAHNARKLHESS